MQWVSALKSCGAPGRVKAAELCDLQTHNHQKNKKSNRSKEVYV
jgi:hypothetical protein